MIRIAVDVVLVALLAATPLGAQTTTPPPAPATPAAPAAPATPAKPSLADRLINVPGAAWSVYGPNQTTQQLEKEGPQGYPATRVTVAAKGANAWDVGASSPIAKPIAAGDVVFVVAYLRAPSLKDGETTPVPMVGAQRATAPYEAIATGNANVTNQWKQYYGVGKAPAAYPAGGANVAVHLSADKHVVDLGPVRVFDLGPDFDANRLPKNP